MLALVLFADSETPDNGESMPHPFGPFNPHIQTVKNPTLTHIITIPPTARLPIVTIPLLLYAECPTRRNSCMNHGQKAVPSLFV